MRLSNGTVLPSSLMSVRTEVQMSAFNQAYSNSSLKMGFITRVHEMGDPNNLRLLGPEYDVLIWEQGEKGPTSLIYKNCLSIDSLGGVADFFEAKLRPKTKTKDEKDFYDTDGNLVLLLCMDGKTESGIIVGGLKHIKRLTKLTKEAGLHLEGEYNGLNWKIDKDGALVIKFKSPTDSTGKVVKPELSGSTLKVEKDGSVEANTDYNDKKGEHIRLDKTKQTIDTSSRKDSTFSAGEQLNLVSKKNMNATSGADFILKATGACNVAAGSLTVDSKGAVSIKGSAAEMTFEGACKIKASAIDLSAPQVKVGEGASFAAVLGPQLLDWLKSHTHPPIPPLVGGPVLAPIVPPPPSILSKSVLIKD